MDWVAFFIFQSEYLWSQISRIGEDRDEERILVLPFDLGATIGQN